MKTDPYAKALAAASAAPIRREMGSTPAGNPISNWRSALAGALHRASCDELLERGHIRSVVGDPTAYELTERGARRLAELRAPDRAWLA